MCFGVRIQSTMYNEIIFAGGYQCRCRPSHRRPNNVRRSYLGEIIERATPKQYYGDFGCKRVGFVQRLPQQWDRAPKWLRDQYIEKYPQYMNYSEDITPSIGKKDKMPIGVVTNIISLSLFRCNSKKET